MYRFSHCKKAITKSKHTILSSIRDIDEVKQAKVVAYTPAGILVEI